MGTKVQVAKAGADDSDPAIIESIFFVSVMWLAIGENKKSLEFRK